MPVLIVLLAAGSGLLVFGALVLLRFPDRPGGTIEATVGGQTLRVSSLGAGLPLIAIGAALLALAVVGPWPDDSTPSPTSHPTASAADSACPGEFLADIPSDRVRTLEAGARDVPLLRPDQSKSGVFGLVLNDGGLPAGAIRMQFFLAGEIFRVIGVRDSRCAPVEEFLNESRQGEDKHVLGNWDTLRLRLGDHIYTLRPGYKDAAIGATFRTVAE
ncbi:hypothetical protein [Streptomyces sp. NPDC090445]|uniref:hypothetical protein n=1 Tax=Streptomyces sp. NPDC090445 TaxID=3365963 RepID=UPI0037F544C9